jgi:hypothetical protein
MYTCQTSKGGKRSFVMTNKSNCSEMQSSEDAELISISMTLLCSLVMINKKTAWIKVNVRSI